MKQNNWKEKETQINNVDKQILLSYKITEQKPECIVTWI